MKLRPYQSAAIDATWNYLAARDGNPCIVLPTGSGKTIVMAEMIRHALTTWPGTRICVLAHVRELVAQNADKLKRYWPEAPLGIYSAGLRRRDRFESVIFASIQSVAKHAMRLGRFDLLLVDEAHRIPLKTEGQYRQFIEGCRRANPKLRIAGLTATPYRLGGGPVCGPEHILTDVAYEADVGDLIRDGYLCKLTTRAGVARANLEGVHIRNGDYARGELERAVNVAGVVNAACDEIVARCADRNAWLVFCAGVDHAHSVHDALTARSIKCAVVTGKTPAAERDAIVAAYQRRELRALINVNVFSEGFDATFVDAVIMLRPTKSAALYYQQVGRGLRIDEAKSDCLVLDFAGNITEHGPIDAIRPPKAPGQKADSAAPVRECPECHIFVPIQLRECSSCGYAWPVSEFFSVHGRHASDAAILASEVEPTRYPVKSVRYAAHIGKSGVPSLQVTYQCGLRTFREYVCLEHSGFPRAKAVHWWNARQPAVRAPLSVEAALEVTDGLPIPAAIHVVEVGKYPEIVKHEFAEPDASDESADAGRPGQSAGADCESARRDPLRELRALLGQGRVVPNLEDDRARSRANEGV